MSEDLSGKVALVVGASGGFGSAIARQLAAEGAAVALVGRNRETLEAVVDEILHSDGKAFAICGDARVAADVSRVYSQTAEKFGKPSILIDAAAVGGPYGPIGEFAPEQWWDAMSIHLKAPLLLIHQVLPEMLRRSEGRIIILSSLVGQMIYPHLSAYSIGKAAQASLVAHAAAEHRNSGVSFFAIQPGVAYTKMAEGTMASREFQRWAPEAVERLKKVFGANDDNSALAACAERCCQLASGRFDELSGRFLKPEDDLEDLLTRVATD